MKYNTARWQAIADARSLTRSLGGKWYGSYGTTACPICQRERRRDQNALTISTGRDGRLLLHCKKSGCSFRDILAAAGVAPARGVAWQPAVPRREVTQHDGARRTSEFAARLWREAAPSIDGTPAAAYLEHRGIALERWPEVLRFHPALRHPSAKHPLPALLAKVDGPDLPAVHRTYLRPDGRGKADITPAKMTLGATAGGAVRLTDGAGLLLVGEGIESTLSAWLLRGDPTARAWACLSTSGMRALRLPAQPAARLCIAADGDPPGLEAASALAQRASALGWRVTVASPPPSGMDWNDVLRAGGGR